MRERSLAIVVRLDMPALTTILAQAKMDHFESDSIMRYLNLNYVVASIASALVATYTALWIAHPTPLETQ